MCHARTRTRAVFLMSESIELLLKFMAGLLLWIRRFEGLSPLERSRLVHEILKDEIKVRQSPCFFH